MSDVFIHRVNVSFTGATQNAYVTLAGGSNSDPSRFFVRLCTPMTKCISRRWSSSDDMLARDRVGYMTGWVTYQPSGTDQVELTFNVLSGYPGTAEAPVEMEAVVWEFTGEAGSPNEFVKINSHTFQFAPADYQVAIPNPALPTGVTVEQVIVFHRGIQCVGVSDGNSKQWGSLGYTLAMFNFFVDWYAANRGQQSSRTDHVHAEAVAFTGSNWKKWRSGGNIPTSAAGNQAHFGFLPAWNSDPAQSPPDLWDHCWLYSQRRGETNNIVANRSMLVTPDTSNPGQISIRSASDATFSAGNNYAWVDALYNADLFESLFLDSWSNPSDKIAPAIPDALQTKRVQGIKNPSNVVRDSRLRFECDATFLVEGAHGYGGAVEFLQTVDQQYRRAEYLAGQNGFFINWSRPTSYRKFAAGDLLGDTHWALSSVRLPDQLPALTAGKKLSILLKDGSVHSSDFYFLDSSTNSVGGVVQLVNPAPTETVAGAPWVLTDSETTYWRALSVAQGDGSFTIEATRHDPSKQDQIEDFADIGAPLTVTAPSTPAGVVPLLYGCGFLFEDGNWYAEATARVLSSEIPILRLTVTAATLSVTRQQLVRVDGYAIELTFKILLGPHATWAGVGVAFEGVGVLTDGVTQTPSTTPQVLSVPASVP